MRFTVARGAQGYAGTADWELIKRVAQSSPIPIIGNGDILTAESARGRLENGYAHAVMIGRGALKNPWLFREILGVQNIDYDFTVLLERHFELALRYRGSFARLFCL